MGIKQAIRAWLLADTTISGLIGSRLSPMLSGVGHVLPRVIYERISSDVEEEMGGQSFPIYDTFNILIETNTSDEGETIRQAIIDRMAELDHTTQDSILISRSFFRGGSEGYELKNGKEAPVYQAVIAFEVIHNG